MKPADKMHFIRTLIVAVVCMIATTLLHYTYLDVYNMVASAALGWLTVTFARWLTKKED